MAVATNICIALPGALIFLPLLRTTPPREGCVGVGFKGLLCLVWFDFDKDLEHIRKVPTVVVTRPFVYLEISSKLKKKIRENTNIFKFMF